MTAQAIQKQIEVIRQVNSEVRKSPQTTLKFLADVGIIKDEPPKKNKQKNKK